MNTLIIGAGGVGRVVAHKCAMCQEVFGNIFLASKTVSKCNEISKEINQKYSIRIHTEFINAEDLPEVIRLFKKIKPDVLIHVALPYQNLVLMEACLEIGVHYLDTANYEPPHEAKFEYSWQWNFHNRFKKAKLTAILGCGFDPGVTGVYTAYAAKHHFDAIHYLDIVDCNAGEHGFPFATNFNPEINIREIMQKGKYFEDNHWIETPPQAVKKKITYPNIGVMNSYLIYHEELESLVKNFPTLRRARFWMTFSDNYLKHLEVIKNLGLNNIHPIEHEGNKIIPLKFLKTLLPNPATLAKNYQGETSIGCKIGGVRENQKATYYIYNNCKHQHAYIETKSHGVAYTTGVPATLGAKLLLQGVWEKPGVWNVEQLNPDPFMLKIGNMGLPWIEEHNVNLAFD